MNYRQDANDIEETAARWVWRLDGANRSPALERELEEWLEGDPRRRGAFLQAQAMWSALDAASQVEAQQAPVRRRWAIAIAATALIAIASIAALEWPIADQRYQTVVGELRQVPLPDGSAASINTSSAIAVYMQKEWRLIELKKGEAWFRVANDATRPFIVEAGRVRVQALGTAFSVRRRETGVSLWVSEGVVETWVEGAEGHKVRVGAGNKAFVAENAAITRESTADAEIDRALAWRMGKIDLAGEKLADAVAEFNRYNRRKLVIADARLAEERLYGVFRTDDPEGFAYAVSRSLGAVVSQAGADEIRLGE